MRIKKKTSHRNEQQTAVYRSEPFQIILELLTKDKKIKQHNIAKWVPFKLNEEQSIQTMEARIKHNIFKYMESCINNIRL